VRVPSTGLLRKPLERLAVVSALVACVACGPIEYVNTVTRRADAAVEGAKAVQADKYSPYYYTLATQYLHKAREEASYADFQAANRFGRLAADAADKAREESVRRAKDPEAMQELQPLPVGQGEEPDNGLAPLGGGDGDADSDGNEDDELPPGLGDEP
jgi:hypothetical protein